MTLRAAVTALSFGFLVVIFVRCSHGNAKPAEEVSLAPIQREAVKGLSIEAARDRAARVSGVRYSLEVDLDGVAQEYTGTLRAEFDLSDNSRALSIDFNDGTISSLKINGNDLKPVEYNGFFVTLPVSQLVQGHNTVEISFSHEYDRHGVGLYRFNDPEDGRVYLYTNFEPYDANRFFPCFDQPDLKARYTVEATVPADWSVISSTKESSREPLENGKVRWSFPVSELFSTYLISLHAGPYKVWNAKAGEIPIRLFARRALAKHVVVNDWLEPTKEGLAFYQKYFDFRYPYKKYDQIIVPDFNAGAMENVAAVTFSENAVKRGKPTSEEREGLAGIILHEMAHQWFGDLVTMRWWNDLWLNESFATYMSYLALEKATPFKRAWVTFLGNKVWAATEDQFVTTHPVKADVKNTDEAFANFDGITYGKGASALQQLAFLVGEDQFRDGVRWYFKNFAFKNAELSDFMGAVQKQTREDLKQWTHDWLETAGVNKVLPDVSCVNDKIFRFRLLQSSPEEYPTLRTHRTEIGLYRFKSARALTPYKTLATTYFGPETDVRDLVGAPCPDFIYPNQGDNDYMKVEFDEKSLKSIQQSLGKITDPLTRLMAWHGLWDMVRDGRFSVANYADLVLTNIENENDIKILNQVLSTVGSWSGSGSSVLWYLPDDYGARSRSQAMATDFEVLTWNGIVKNSSDPDLQKRFFDSFVALARSPEALAKLSDMLGGKLKPGGLVLDEDRRWDAVRQLNLFNAPGSLELLEQEKRADQSHKGELMALASEASRPEERAKDLWWTKLLEPKGLTFNEARYVMKNLFPFSQASLKQKFEQKYYDNIEAVARSKPDDFQSVYASAIVPQLCDDASSDRLARAIGESKGLTAIMSKRLKIARQENQRCARARALAFTTTTNVH